MGDEEMRAIEIIGYDASANTYPTYAFDSQGNFGTYKASLQDGIWRFTGETERAKVVFSNNDKLINIKWERLSDDATWLPWMDVKLNKES